VAPALSIATLRPQQNVVAVLVDDSRSMSLADASGTREAAAQAVLNGGLLKSLGDRSRCGSISSAKSRSGFKARAALGHRAGLAHRRYAGARARGIVLAAAGRHGAAERRGR